MGLMLALCIASLVLAQNAPGAVVLVGTRSTERSHDAKQWEAAGYRAEAAAEGLLRARGFKILDPKRHPEFSPKNVGEAHDSLRTAIKASGAAVAIGIQVVGVHVTTPDHVPRPIEVTMSGKPIPPKDWRPKPTHAEVIVRVWLLESGEAKLFIDGKTPVGYETGHGSVLNLVGGASSQAIGDVLRRFLRLRSPRQD